MKIKASVIGDGAWGTAVATLLNSNGHSVSLWGPFPDNIREIRRTGENAKFLPGVKLPPEIRLCESSGDALSDTDLIVLAIPSQFMREVLKSMQPASFAGRAVVNLAKGIENESLKRMSQVFADEMKDAAAYAVLSGPSHAEEVAVGQPTAVVVASSDKDCAALVQKAMMSRNFRIYTSGDIVGVELGGSLKNIFAIAAGIADGMKLGDNTKAALITRGIAELSRLGTALGGRPETFSGLSGIGDLIVTCMSRHSRNRFVGEELGKGRRLDDIIASMGKTVAEGVRTCLSAYELARDKEIEAPIINEVHAGLYDGKDPRKCLIDLMTRKAKSEF